MQSRRSSLSPNLVAELKAIGWLVPIQPPQPVVDRSLPRSKQKAHPGRFSPTYLKFINSPEWRTKRQERLNLDTVNGRVICQFCGKPCTPKDPAEVDHFRYPPWDATFEDFVNQPIEDLRSLHKSCHKMKTRKSRKK